MKYVLRISSSHLCEVEPRLFSCSSSTSSMPASFPFLSATINFLYSSSEKGCTNVTSPVASVGSTWHLGFARHGASAIDELECELVEIEWEWECWSGGVIGDVLNSLPRLATVMYQIRRCNNFFPSLLLRYVILSTSLVPASMVVLPNRLLEYWFLYTS